MSTLFVDVNRGATLSDDGLYRYDLWRTWGEGLMLGFIMFNPSTADASIDDPTIRRCMGFAKREGMAGIVVRNLFAFRTPKPAVLKAALKAGTDVVGPENDEWLAQLTANQRLIPTVVAAWGSPGPYAEERIAQVVAEHDWRLSRFNRPGPTRAPHPLYLSKDMPIVSYLTSA